MPEVLFKVADALEAAESMGVTMDWFDNVIEKISKVNDHQKLVQNIGFIKE